MTKSQQTVLSIILVMLLAVAALLAIAVARTRNAASTAPIITLIPTITVPPTRLPTDIPSANTVPPTWTPEPTRTPVETSTPRFTHTAIPLPTITRTFAPTFTPQPTSVVTGTAVVTYTPSLVNPGFDGVGANVIPGWSWWAADNFTPGGAYNPDTSFDTPLFKRADDPARFIDGPTLQIDAVQHLKFRVHVFQTVAISPTSEVRFRVTAGAFSDTGAIQIAAGIDANGRPNCDSASWSQVVYLDQETGVQTILAPVVTVGARGQVTVCLLAEPVYAAVSNAAFFDKAELIVNP